MLFKISQDLREHFRGYVDYLLLQLGIPLGALTKGIHDKQRPFVADASYQLMGWTVYIEYVYLLDCRERGTTFVRR